MIIDGWEDYVMRDDYQGFSPIGVGEGCADEYDGI